MFSNAEMKVATFGCLGFEVAGALEFEERLGGRPKVRRAAQEPGDVLGEHVQDLAGGVAPGDAFGVRREARQVAVPRRGQLTPLHLVDLGGELGELPLVGGELPLPLLARRSAASADAGVELLARTV